MPPPEAPDPTFDRINRRLDELQASEPRLSQVAGYYRALAGLFHGALPLSEPKVESLAQRQATLGGGQSLLPQVKIVFAPEPARQFFGQVARLVSTFQPGAAQVLAALDDHRLDPLPPLADLAHGDPLEVEALCESAGVAPLTLRVLLEYSLRPTLRAWATGLLQGLDLSGWQKPACPVCGNLPLLAEWDPAARRRSLRCAICGAGWPFPVTRCPGCGNSDPTSQGMLSFDGDERTFAQTCRVCQVCVKTIVTSEPIPHDLLSLEDLLSVDLDQGCQERGYRRVAGPISSPPV